jgi:hypothetical protein
MSIRRWEDKLKMDVEYTGYKNVDWIHLARYRD